MTRSYGRRMEPVPQSEWPFFPEFETVALRVWRSKDYLAVLYKQRADGRLRLTVNSTRRMRVPISRKEEGTDWRDGITWDELQRIKNECLGEDVWCVEVFPAEDAKVDIYNQRHLWPLDGPPATRFPTKAVFTDAEVRQAVQLVRTLKEAMAT